MVKWIPNFLTLCNLFCGVLGIYFAFNSHMDYSAYLVGIAAIFDFLDGTAARLLHVKSEIGKQLDSLADMVTFGVLPGVILFNLIQINYGEYYLDFEAKSLQIFMLSCTGFVVTLFSALRLAIFNVDTRQTDSFIGMPTPANTIFIVSLPFAFEKQFNINFYPGISQSTLTNLAADFHWNGFDNWIAHLFTNPWFYVVLSLISSYLLVSPLRMFSLKFKNLKWKDNKLVFTFLITIVLLGLMVAFPYLSFTPYIKNYPFIDYLILPLIILLYLILSFYNHFSKKPNNELQS